ncbi:sucrose transport protein [Pseudovirgaria hyperparasitica]|uniref:Sucrose transport protein n=1 Tax=Pseudovirgaria hyperparasitica TaxID=470096 RepID=A0A6A6W205_9PEZI|nr:sucrose transport protein [Pseudovirgaria hyperparasitica]KAF2756044.1 sucrose transport protein [Pseudovirgaria hyperparasitica]
MPQTSRWIGTPAIKGSSESVRMALLTASLVGLQFTWGLEMSYCTPYLLELGLTKSKISLVWVAGPLSGLIMQPVVGVIADKSTSRWGRRRPFMVYGTVVVVCCLYVLGWTREVVGLFVGDKEMHRDATIFVAVMSIYAIDFAINAVQASCRGLVVDTLPIPKQQLGSSWASRMVATGSLLSYAAGAVDLERFFGDSIGDTQFKRLTAVACFALCLAVGVTSFAVNERVLVIEGEADETSGPINMLKFLLRTALNLPPRIAAICKINLYAWIGWFPFLFYSTTWVGEIYLRYEAPHVKHESTDTLGEVGRIGSRSMIVFSIVTFVGTVIYPFFIKSPQQSSSRFTPRPPEGLESYITSIEKYKPTLQTAWMCGHLIFAGAMFWAPGVTSVRAATLLVAICGIPWAIQAWSPWTFIGVEINRLGQHSHTEYADERGRRDSLEMNTPLSPKGANLLDDDTQSGAAELSGVYLGILNLYTTLPQFIATLISWIVFSIFEPGKSPELAKEAHPDEHAPTGGYNGISICLFIGAVSMTGASLMTRRFRRMGM